MGWGQVGNVRGDPQGVRGGEPYSVHLPLPISLLPTNIENMLGHAPPSHTPRRHASHARASRRLTAIVFCCHFCIFHLPHVQ